MLFGQCPTSLLGWGPNNLNTAVPPNNLTTAVRPCWGFVRINCPVDVSIAVVACVQHLCVVDLQAETTSLQPLRVFSAPIQLNGHHRPVCLNLYAFTLMKKQNYSNCQINSARNCLSCLGCEKVESEGKRVPQQTNEAVENGSRRVRLERLVTSSKDAMTKTIKRHDQHLALILKLNDSASLLRELETWLNVMTTTNNELLKRARQYNDLLPAVDKASQSSSKTRKKIVSKRSANKDLLSETEGTAYCRIPRRRTRASAWSAWSALHLAKQKQIVELQKL